MNLTPPRICVVALRHAACISSCCASHRRARCAGPARSRLTLLSHYSHCLRSYLASPMFAMLDQYSASLRSPALHSRLLRLSPQSFEARLVPSLHSANAAGAQVMLALARRGRRGVQALNVKTEGSRVFLRLIPAQVTAVQLQLFEVALVATHVDRIRACERGAPPSSDSPDAVRAALPRKADSGHTRSRGVDHGDDASPLVGQFDASGPPLQEESGTRGCTVL